MSDPGGRRHNHDRAVLVETGTDRGEILGRPDLRPLIEATLPSPLAITHDRDQILLRPAVRTGGAVLQAYLDISLNLVSALVAGSLIGLERTFHGRPAGFRTHALVCVASALLMVLSAYQWKWLIGAPTEIIRTDPTRMAQGIMTGIGFLGAGVIFKEGLTVRGLTTAASIWMTAALGILYGVGLYFPAILATVITLGILAVFSWFEERLPSKFYTHY
jgi:uncharacterized membrane protein YhiD involved in acid resistance